MDNPLTRRDPAQAPAPLAPSLPAGTVIAGRFTLEALAGRGGMGTVYRATDFLSGQRVALKLLHPASNPEAPRRFLRKAELLSALRHPGIVAYITHGHCEQGQPFLAMEWLEGENLAQRLSYEPLRLEETLALLRHAAQALSVAHQRGVIHRDLKPSNLFLRHGRPEDVVLLDFGLARHVVPSTAITASQMTLGTPGYMAPEQVSGHSQLTPGADVFSLGCVLYECLTGQLPFRASHLAATLAKILFTEPTPLCELRPELPVALQELLEHMLAKEPARRLQDASSLLSALEQVRSLLETGPGTTAPLGAPLPRLASVEQQLVTVLLAAPRATAALVAFLRAECAHHPVLLVLEDVHWGDLLSIKLLDDVLRALSEQPFMVLALARPEVEQLLPGPWTQRMQEVPLRGLGRKAGERLVREMLGPGVSGSLIEQLVEQAAGNALFLEELIRGVAEGRGEAAPRTVLAMLQARLGRLEPQARHVLLAASFLGRTFWSGGVRALLGEALSGSELRHWLQRLEELEWVESQPGSRFPPEDEYRFRHALVRDAAAGRERPAGARRALPAR